MSAEYEAAMEVGDRLNEIDQSLMLIYATLKELVNELVPLLKLASEAVIQEKQKRDVAK